MEGPLSNTKSFIFPSKFDTCHAHIRHNLLVSHVKMHSSTCKDETRSPLFGLFYLDWTMRDFVDAVKIFNICVWRGWKARVHGWWCSHQFKFPKWMIVDDNMLSKHRKGWHQLLACMVRLIWSHTFIYYLRERGGIRQKLFLGFKTHSKGRPRIRLSNMRGLPCEQSQMNQIKDNEPREENGWRVARAASHLPTRVN